MLVKVFGFGGLRAYLREKQNIFDFVVVMTSLPSIIIPLSAGTFQQKSSLAAVSSFRVFRLFRVFRVARLLHKVKSMRNLLAAVLGSFSSLMNLLFFIAFALVTLSIAATSLFSRSLPPTPDVAQAVDSHGYRVYATGQSPRYNFDSFFNSFVSLFIIMSGKITKYAMMHMLQRRGAYRYSTIIVKSRVCACTPARSPYRAYVARVPCLRQCQSFPRTLLSQELKFVE